MNSVWVIERGSYSDYEVLGIYTSEEKAKAVAAVLNEKWDSARVGKWDLDPGLDGLAPHCGAWSITMDHLGQVQSVQRSFGIPEGLHVDNRWKRVGGEVWARDQGHAVKIANEYRAQAIAEGRLRTG